MAELDRAGISARMGQAREQAGLTQPEISEALQRDGEPLHWRTVQNYESPKNNRVPWDLLDQWARITGVTKEWLLHGENAVETDHLAAIEEELRLLRAELAAVRETLPVVEDVLALARDLQALLRGRAGTP